MVNLFSYRRRFDFQNKFNVLPSVEPLPRRGSFGIYSWEFRFPESEHIGWNTGDLCGFSDFEIQFVGNIGLRRHSGHILKPLAPRDVSRHVANVSERNSKRRILRTSQPGKVASKASIIPCVIDSWSDRISSSSRVLTFERYVTRRDALFLPGAMGSP